MSYLDEKNFPYLTIEQFVKLYSEEKLNLDNFHVCKLSKLKSKSYDFRGEFYEIYIEVMEKEESDFYTEQSGKVIFSYPGVSRSGIKKESTNGYNISFTPDFFLKVYPNYTILNELIYFQLNSNFALDIQQNNLHLIVFLSNKIYKLYYSSIAKKEDLIRGYLNVLLLELERVYVKGRFNEVKVSKSHILVNKFKNLISHHFLSKKSVQDYAYMLQVSTKHLCHTVKLVTGHTAHHLISELVLLEAKSLLQQTNMTVSEIANHLQFTDVSYFARFFRKYTTYSPLKYRYQYRDLHVDKLDKDSAER